MPSGDLIFSSLRSSAKPIRRNQQDAPSSANSEDSSVQHNTRYGSDTRRLSDVSSGKNLTIKNNTLTIGVSSQASEPAFNGPRMKLSATGLKALQQRSEKVHYENDIQHGQNLGPESEADYKDIKKVVELELAFHESKSSSEQVMVDVASIKGARVGDLAELKTYRSKPGSKDKKLYFIIKDFDAETKRRSKNRQVSILSGQLQQALDLPLRSKVWIKLKDKRQLAVDLVELHVKDCYVNRGDMWQFSSQLSDRCVFLGERVGLIDTVRATVKGIYSNGKKVFSGYINDNTKIIFRSEAARILFMIQITDEMWHFEENGEETFQKVVSSLFPEIFRKWKNIGTHHSISIIFCASIDRSEATFADVTSGERLKSTDHFYRVVVDQVNIVHWVEIMKTLRKEFIRIAQDLRNVRLNENVSVIRGVLPSVIKSNLLETVNFATTLVTDPFKHNDLRHTATHAIIVTAGSGLYDVDYDLLKITTQKLMSLEITMDLICLTRPPLHIVPLFRYRDYKNELHHCTPSWLSISFWNDSSRANVEWRPRCKIYDVLMMGLTETELKEEIALRPLKFSDRCHSVAEFMQAYDSDVFNCRSDPYSVDISDSVAVEFQNTKHESKNASQSRLLSNGKVLHTSPFTDGIKWNKPKSTDAVLQQTFREEIFAQISYPPNSQNVQTLSEQRVASQLGESPALNTLKKLRDSESGVAHRILSTLFPDVSSKRSYDSLRLKRGADNNGSSTIPVSCGSYAKKTTRSRSFVRAVPGDNDSRDENSCDTSVLSTHSSQNRGLYDKKNHLTDTSLKSSILNQKQKKSAEGDTWIEIENPSVPVDAELATFLIPNRWKDVFPKYVAKKYTKWRSFTTPAELPLTTSMFPSLFDLENQYAMRIHTVSLNMDQEGYQQSIYDLLQNMIYVRLLAGFQFCLGRSVVKVEKSLNKDNELSKITNVVTKDNYKNVSVYLRIDNEIHRIVCSDETIDVQRYVKPDQLNLLGSFPKYTPFVKTRYEADYRELDLDPVKAKRESYNWNHLDQVLAGYGDNVLDASAQKRFRCKFVVLPAEIPPNTFQSTINGRKETLTAEEIRLEGLRKIISSISRSRLRTEHEKKDRKSYKEEILPEVLFYTGYLFDFIEDQNDFLKNSGTAIKNSIFMENKETLNKDSDITKIAFELQHGVDPIKLVNRKWHWKRHENCFIGLELVNWIIEHFEDIHTREDAVIYGQELMAKGLFLHVESRHGFLDGHYFYQIKPEYVNESRPLSKTTTKQSNDNHLQRHVSTSNRSESTKSTNPASELDSQQHMNDQVSKSEEQKINVMLSNAVVIDLDPNRKSYKLETCIAHYDRVHNPEHCFHIRLEWLTATPKLIDDLITNWSRLAERYGLRLVEIPWDELCNIPRFNPFHSFMNIKLAINPWQDLEFKDDSIFREQKFFYHIYLLEKSGFLLDNRASKFFLSNKSNNKYQIAYSWGKPMFKYAQYIHYTGSCMAEIRESGDLFLAPNNLHISRVNIGNIVSKASSYPKFTLDVQKIMLHLRKTCESYESLRDIFLEAREKHLEERDVDEYSPFESFNLYT